MAAININCLEISDKVVLTSSRIQISDVSLSMFYVVTYMETSPYRIFNPQGSSSCAVYRRSRGGQVKGVADVRFYIIVGVYG